VVGPLYPEANSKGQEMNQATIYTTSWCPSCVNAKAFFENKGVTYTEIDVEQWDDPRGRLETITGQRSVPQILIGETHVGGFDDLLALHQDGVLDELLKASV
jgi:glutaredoxin 3